MDTIAACASKLPPKPDQSFGIIVSWTNKTKGRSRDVRPAVNKIAISWDAGYLSFLVREPFPNRTTGTGLVFGRITPEQPLVVTSQMAENGVIISDGIESDYLEFNSGACATVTLADRQGRRVV